MKILWLCNVMLPVIAQELKMPTPIGGGWLSGAAEMLSANNKVKLTVCFPQRRFDQLIYGTVNGISYYGFPSSPKKVHIYNNKLEIIFSKILHETNPDIVHIWGTECSHALTMTKIFAKPEKTIINIQGLCGICAQHYMAHLLPREYKRITIRDAMRWDWLVRQQKKFYMRGELEKQALQGAGHVIGRTRWDRACASQLTPNASYYHCNETLRRTFYANAGNWTPDKCERHSLFVSQASYPLKGFHMVLDAMPKVLDRYPDAKLYTTGKNPLSLPFYKLTGYQRILKKRIITLGLRDHIVFLGDLDETNMCERFLKSNVFVSASSIENSPNSVGEAMLLGVPIVASYVGGTMDMLQDGEEGFLYQSDAPYMLADRVCKILANDELARNMGRNATKHAIQTHNAEKNFCTMMKIYDDLFCV